MTPEEHVAGQPQKYAAVEIPAAATAIIAIIIAAFVICHLLRSNMVFVTRSPPGYVDNQLDHSDQYRDSYHNRKKD